MSKSISIAVSSDSDDAVMVHAIKHGLVDCLGYECRISAADIQELNETAVDPHHHGYDVTALSAAAFAHSQPHYELMPVGASMGFSWGPAVVVPAHSDIHQPQQLAGQVLAMPGVLTSAYNTALMVLPVFRPLFMSFDKIEHAVSSATADGGLLIHEAQLGIPRSVKKLASLNELWQQATGTQLPLPLGVIGMRKSLATAIKSDIIKVYRASIEYGLEHLTEILQHIAPEFNTGLSDQDSRLYIKRYVAASAMRYTHEMKQGMELWFELGAQRGLWQVPTSLWQWDTL